MTMPREPRTRDPFASLWLILLPVFACVVATECSAADDAKVERRLYVAAPGIRNYLEHGGHGLLVFDVDHDHTFIKRIATAGLNANGKPNNVKGICANAATNRLYISTIQQLMCLDLTTEKLIWERSYEGGCDRMSITPDGRLIYLPSLEGPFWNVVRGEDGEVVAKVILNSGAHNTVVGLDGSKAYLAGLKSPFLAVVDTTTQKVVRSVGPFAASIRPFTVNGRQTRCFVNINELLGFEIGDLTTGQHAGPCRGARLREGGDQAPRLPQPRHRPDPGRDGSLGLRRPQHAASHLRRHHHAPQANRVDPAQGRARLGHVHDRRRLRIPLDGRRDRRQVAHGRRPTEGRKRPVRSEREADGNRLSGRPPRQGRRSVRPRAGRRPVGARAPLTGSV